MVVLGPKGAVAIMVALVVSLGVNMFLGGWLLGRAIGDRETSAPPSAQRSGTLDQPAFPAIARRLAQRLPEAERALFKAAFEEHRAALQGANRKLRLSRQAVRRALSAETFDANALDSALDRMAAANDSLQRAIYRAMGEAVKALPPEARRGLAAQTNRNDQPRRSGR